VLAYPSLYEGFGLPLLEAMAFGLPVVALNKGTMKEVVADAGLLIETTNPMEFADALYQLLQSPSEMAFYSARSKLRAGMFSWDVAVNKTMRVYSSL
jgi:glycosyltransferase involved in cell wall biosynthesis